MTTTNTDQGAGVTEHVFSGRAKAEFANLYPEQSGKLSHQLGDHDLLSLDALADMAGNLPPESVEYNRGNLPIGIAPQDVPHNGLAVAETIRTIDKNGSWMVLKNIEQVPAYGALLQSLLEELASTIAPTTGELLTPQGYIFISSPDAVTPFHFDPEHNILLQLRGSKTMHVWPAGDARFAPDVSHETYHAGGHRNLPWEDRFSDEAQAVALSPGDAVYVPVMAPHWVKNGSAASISLSITWRSEWSYRESEARRTNRLMRQAGLSPKAPPRWPRDARLKSLFWRGARRIGIVK